MENEIKILAEKLVSKYLPDWKFVFNNRTSSVGLCSYRKKTIYLSKVYITQLSEKELYDILYHEIAHALTEGEYHNNVWRKKCIEIGGNGERCFQRVLKRKNGKYNYICINCETKINRVRRINRRVACIECCNKYNNGKFSDKFLFEEV